MPDVDLTAELARIRERAEYAKEYMQGDPMPLSLDDVPRLLDAVEKVLALADDWEEPAGYLLDNMSEPNAQARECAAELREAITRALTGAHPGAQQRGGDDSGA